MKLPVGANPPKLPNNIQLAPPGAATAWTTTKPTEPGFYFATDGSPVLYLWIISTDGEMTDYATWQSAWAGDDPYFLPKMFTAPTPNQWCKIALPDKPAAIKQ